MISAPRHICEDDHAETFSSGEGTLDEWLRRRAWVNETLSASRTYVVADHGSIMAYYSLAAGVLHHETVSGRMRRNMPDPIPAMLLARLAVDSRYQRRGLGRALVRDAMLRTVQASEVAGIRALFVNALNDKAAEFYLLCGFDRSPAAGLLLMVRMDDIRAALGI